MTLALQVTSPGAGSGSVALNEIRLARPAAGELRIAVRAVSASHLDLGSIQGSFPASPVPRTIGTDPTGVVVDVGDGVDRARIGGRVAVKPNVFCGQCDACRHGGEADCPHQQILGVHRDGGAAAEAIVPARCAFPLPDSLTDVQACALVHTAPVALHMLRVARDDYAGRTVLVTGAAGAVGSATVQLVLALGGHPIAAVREPGEVSAIDGLGADHVIDTSRGPLGDLVRELAPKGVDVAVDTTGAGPVATAAVGCLGWRGAFVTCAGRGTLELSQAELYRGRRRILGSAGSDVRDVTDALRMAGDGAISPLLGMQLPLTDYERGYAALTDPSRTGKIVFEVNI